MKFNKILAAVVLVAITFIALPVLAQPGPPANSGGGPVDGGVITLVLGAAAYGYKKMKAKKNKEEN